MSASTPQSGAHLARPLFGGTQFLRRVRGRTATAIEQDDLRQILIAYPAPMLLRGCGLADHLVSTQKAPESARDSAVHALDADQANDLPVNHSNLASPRTLG